MFSPISETETIEGGNKKIFKKLRKLEFFYLEKILRIESIRNKIISSTSEENKEKISKSLLEYLNSEHKVFIINKKQKKVKKSFINLFLEKNQLEEVLDIIHFPSKILLKKIEPFLSEEEYKCIQKITKDEKDAIDIITAMHYPAILKIVSHKIKENPYFAKYENDLINEGFIGIVESIYKFDTSKGYKFITYAMPWIAYRINSFIDNIVKEIDYRNGNYKKHIFKDKIFIDDSYIEDFREKIYDYDFYIPLAYIFPKLNFEKLNILKSNLNMILNNYSYTKRIINHCKKNNYFSQIILDNQNRPEIAARLILEKSFPYIVKMNNNFKLDSSSNEKMFFEDDFLSSKNTLETEFEKDDLIELILKVANNEESEKIKKFLNNEISIRRIQPVLNNLKKKLEKEGIKL